MHLRSLCVLSMINPRHHLEYRAHQPQHTDLVNKGLVINMLGNVVIDVSAVGANTSMLCSQLPRTYRSEST